MANVQHRDVMHAGGRQIILGQDASLVMHFGAR